MNNRFQQVLILFMYGCFAVSCSKQIDSSKCAPAEFTGFWKERCSDAFGVQIKKQAGDLYSVSFCGPGGCFQPGTWMPNTPIVGDPLYRVGGPRTLEIKHGEFWKTLTKCTTDTEPILEYSKKTAEPSSPKRPETAPVTPTESTYKVQPAPTLPYFDWDACPFEGCTYGDWTTESAVEVFDTWKSNQKLISTLPLKTAVKGISGVVITYKPGVIQLKADLPQDDLRSGDTILTYTYRGEGVSAVWFKGRFYPEYDITFARWPDGTGCLGNDCAGNYVDLGKKVWWAKVKLSSGAVGWVNMSKAKFEGVDRFALIAPDFSLGIVRS